MIAGAVVAAAGGGFAYTRVAEPEPPSSLHGFQPMPLTAAQAERGGVGLPVQVADPGIARVGARWYFNWSARPHRGVHLDFVPLVCGYPGNRPVRAGQLKRVKATVLAHREDYPDGTLFLVGNEIGYKAQHDGRTPAQYVRDFHRCYALVKSLNPTFQVSVGPAILSQDRRITRDQVGARDGLDYLAKAIAAYRAEYGQPIPAEYFAATGHVIRADDANFHAWQARLLDLRRILADAGLRDRRVMLTEFGVPLRGSTYADIATFMDRAVRFAATATDDTVGCTADDGLLVQRWAWFAARPLPLTKKLQATGFGAFVLQLSQTSLYDNRGRLTYLGRGYAELMGGRDH